MELWTYSEGDKLLLMGSGAYHAKHLPSEVKERLDDAMEKGVSIIVAEAGGSCRVFQNYLASKDYKDVVVGRARSLRYNAGGWRDVKYGNNLKERERNMIEDCDFAIVIWVNHSGTIKENLKYLKKCDKPTFLYEYDTSRGTEYAGMVEPNRNFNLFYPYLKRFKQQEKYKFNKWFFEKKKNDL
ncbi:MAG: hypothetical protein ACFE8B_14980 [Candidatus Hermodarchaeota archaeon]